MCEALAGAPGAGTQILRTVWSPIVEGNRSRWSLRGSSCRPVKRSLSKGSVSAANAGGPPFHLRTLGRIGGDAFVRTIRSLVFAFVGAGWLMAVPRLRPSRTLLSCGRVARLNHTRRKALGIEKNESGQ